MFRRFRSTTAFLLILVLLLTLAPAQVSQAATGTLTEEEALAMLQEYRIVRGDDKGNVNVTDRLTRAQAAALFVRSVGMESLSTILKDVVPFSDAKGHWAAGEIAMAERLGLMRGDPSGIFRPDSDITYVEILTVLLRMVEKEPTGPWDATRIVLAAQGVGIVPSGVDARSPAIRGKIFWALATTLSGVPAEGGRTLAQRHIDPDPPTIHLGTPTIVTQDERITISGITQGASRVLVQGKPARLDRATGQFTGEAIVDTGTNSVVITAYDFAGNEAVATVTVERKGTISRLRITGPTTVLAGSNTKLTVEGTDSRGNPVALDGVEAEVTGGLATFDLATTTLRVGSKPGRGTLTLMADRVRATYTFTVVAPSSNAAKLVILPVNGGRALALNQETTVTVHVADASGRLIADDYGRPVTLRAEGLSGVTITPVQPVSEKGIATFTLKGSRLGHFRLDAVSGGLETASVEMDVLTDMRVVLSSTARSLKPDGTSTTTIRATLQDQNGRTINNNTNGDMQIQLTATGTDGTLTDAFLTIPRGRSTSSGNDGAFVVGIAPGTVSIIGEFTSSHAYSIQPLILPVTDPLAGVKLGLTANTLNIQPGGTITLTLKVLDSSNRSVTTGAYAFGLKVHTSNNDPIINGLPEGVELSFQGSSYTPVDDGRAANDPLNDPFSVVGRTNGGTATFTLRYNRSGVVTVTPVLKSASYEAYHPDTGVGPASPSSNLYAPPLEVTFAGTPAKVVLTADSDLGSDLLGAATNTAKQLKVRAKVIDSSGAVVPNYTGNITLARLSGGGISSIVGITRKAAVNGVAEFVVQTSSTEGFDLYRATAGTLNSNDLTVSVHKTKAEAPHIVAIRGVKEGDLSPVTGYVGPDADYMDIQLLPQPSTVPGEPNHWVTAKVYRKGQSREFFVSKAIDIASPMPLVKVPKSVLQVGEFQYEVVVNNGAGDSPRSPALDDTSKAMNVVYYSSFRLSTATYDAGSKRLALTGLMVNGGLVDPSKIRLVKGTSEVSFEGATVVTQTSSSLVLALGENISVDPNVFFGAVTVVADSGWFASANGSQIAMPQNLGVTPMANITHAAVDPTYKYLYLYGDGFRQGTLTVNLITVNGGSQMVTLNASTDRVASVTDSQLVVTLSTNTLNAILALSGPLYVTAETGWLRTGTSSNPQRVGAVTGTDHPVYLQAKVVSAAYNRATNTLTLQGSGFSGATMDPAKLTFRRSTSGTAWSPSDTGVVVGADASEISIVFSETDANAFETQFSGRNVYVNTLAGWLVDSLGRMALPIPANSVLFTVPSN